MFPSAGSAVLLLSALEFSVDSDYHSGFDTKYEITIISATVFFFYIKELDEKEAG